MHPTVKNQSTSPHIPNDSEAYQLNTTTTTGDQSTNAKVEVSSDISGSFIFHSTIFEEPFIDCENVSRYVPLFYLQQENTSQVTTTENKETSVAPNQTVKDKPQITTSSAAGSHAAAAAAAKKDEIKILPAVVPVLGYTTAAAPNLYSPIEPGVQLYTGAQPTQSTGFPTAYQQGVRFSCYTISNF